MLFADGRRYHRSASLVPFLSVLGVCLLHVFPVLMRCAPPSLYLGAQYIPFHFSLNTRWTRVAHPLPRLA